MAPRPLIRPRCHNCRRKKVKCDYQQPECRRCLAAGHQCEGYANALTFVMYGNSASKADTILQKQQSSPSPACIDVRNDQQQRARRGPSKDASPPKSVTALASTGNKIPRGLSTPLDTLVAPYFLQLFSNPCPRGGTRRNLGSLSFLPKMAAAQDSLEMRPFQAVKNEFVRVCMASQSLASPMSDVQRMAAYQRCVGAVREALVDPSFRASDATVVAIWLLGIFELVNGSPPAPKPDHFRGLKSVPQSWSLQCQGLEALLKMRGYKKSGSDKLDDIFWIIFSPVQSRYLVSDERPPPIFDQWLDEMEQRDPDNVSIALAAAQFTSRAISIVVSIIDVLRFCGPQDADELLPKVMHQIRDAQVRFDRAVTGGAESLAAKAFEDPYITNALALYYGAGMKAHHYIALLCTCIKEFRMSQASDDSTPEPDAWANMAWDERAESLRSLHRLSQEALDHAALVLQPPSPQGGAASADAVGSSTGQGAWVSCLRLFLPLALTARLPTSCPTMKKGAMEHIRYISKSGIRQAKWYKEGPRPYNLHVDAYWSAEICSCERPAGVAS